MMQWVGFHPSFRSTSIIVIESKEQQKSLHSMSIRTEISKFSLRCTLSYILASCRPRAYITSAIQCAFGMVLRTYSIRIESSFIATRFDAFRIN